MTDKRSDKGDVMQGSKVECKQNNGASGESVENLCEKTRKTGEKRNKPDSGFSPPLTKEKRQSSVPDLFARSKSETPVENESIVKAVIAAFNSPQIYVKFVGELSKNLNRELDIKLAKIEKSTKELEKVVVDLKGENKRLREVCDKRDAEMNTLREELTFLRNEVKECKENVNGEYSGHDNETIEKSIDDLEQYGRRNAVRIHNLKCITHDGVMPAVIALGQQIGVKIDKTDIVRCHMIGKPKPNGVCQGIVKFVHYWKRAELI